MKALSRFTGKFSLAFALLAIAAVSVIAPSAAFAQTVTFDPTDTLALVDDAIAFITAVGLAVLGLIMLAKGIKWVRKAG